MQTTFGRDGDGRERRLPAGIPFPPLRPAGNQRSRREALHTDDVWSGWGWPGTPASSRLETNAPGGKPCMHTDRSSSFGASWLWGGEFWIGGLGKGMGTGRDAGWKPALPAGEPCMQKVLVMQRVARRSPPPLQRLLPRQSDRPPCTPRRWRCARPRARSPQGDGNPRPSQFPIPPRPPIPNLKSQISNLPPIPQSPI